MKNGESNTNNSYIRMLFIDFSLAFNTISLIKLNGKLNTVGMSTTLCSILDIGLPHRQTYNDQLRMGEIWLRGIQGWRATTVTVNT